MRHRIILIYRCGYCSARFSRRTVYLRRRRRCRWYRQSVVVLKITQSTKLNMSSSKCICCVTSRLCRINHITVGKSWPGSLKIRHTQNAYAKSPTPLFTLTLLIQERRCAQNSTSNERWTAAHLATTVNTWIYTTFIHLQVNTACLNEFRMLGVYYMDFIHNLIDTRRDELLLKGVKCAWTRTMYTCNSIFACRWTHWVLCHSSRDHFHHNNLTKRYIRDWNNGH